MASEVTTAAPLLKTDIKQKQGGSQALIDCASGTVGGILQVLVGQPFDTVKVRLQTQSTTNPVYKNMMDCVRQTRAKEGLKGFYKGTTTPLVGIGACVSIQFVVLEAMKRFYSPHGESLTNSQFYLAGAASGIANSVVSGPVEHIRTRLQVQTSSTGTGLYFKGPVDAIKQIYSRYGIAGIYKGQGITMAREFQGYGAYFLAYEWLVKKSMEHSGRQRSELPAWEVCLYGASAGYAMWMTVYPLDAIKSKLQTDAFDPAHRKYSGVLDCARKTLAVEGMAGFFRGIGPCLLRAAPSNAATFMGFEVAMRVLSSNS
ncbi:mitochondrial carrier domain-containing protein [Halteromyces radiatus]|uniref:mitochondrial carrier domain-containing protein n=1 Tax=Halteromyces radiatus TaxID=101107 RepID=UPI00221F3EA6|nr:mitochondrial carrier domain-containing protein [Halteromyces radiatus]KAI8082904.1 mitochondrial carrier domain-containing protein [Halteromyces radiatus]